MYRKVRVTHHYDFLGDCVGNRVRDERSEPKDVRQLEKIGNIKDI